MVTNEQALAFRLDGHHLSRRLSADGLLEAAGACGIQNTPPGSAAISLHARVASLNPELVRQALEVDKVLLQAWSLRGAPHVFPTHDAAVFTQDLLPEDEDALRFFILGAEQALNWTGLSAAAVVEFTGAALKEVLDGRVLDHKRQLDVELARRVEQRLAPEQLAAWRSPSWYGPDQRLGEAIVSFALRLVSLQGLVCFAPRLGNYASFVRTDQWLAIPWPEADYDQARAGLVRRYLRCYGPSNSGHLAEWAGISPSQAARMWQLVESELAEVEFNDQVAWLLEADVPDLLSPPEPSGARFLPAHDPYLQMRDRETLLPDRALQRRVWRAAGSPGVVLFAGHMVGTWQGRKQGRRLDISVEPFAPLATSIRSEIEAEAEGLAPYRECEDSFLRFFSS